MTRPRSTLVSVADTPYYHCIGRCVRRAFLCGFDSTSGRTFDHRRQWILDRLKLLTETFAIELCAYAVMSNHYHLVLRLDPERVRTWTAQDIVTRWTRLFSGPPCAQRFLNGEPLAAAERDLLDRQVQRWAQRLGDLSWFMRCLNEAIARMANQEDVCTGHFWEARFKSQALLDDTALLTAMAYVDLNPVRAGLATTLEEADFTSVQQRLFELARAQPGIPHTPPAQRPALLAFVGNQGQNDQGIPFKVQDYLDLVDTAGRQLRADKRGALPGDAPDLISTLGIEPGAWFKTVTQRQARFECFVGAPHRLRDIANQRGGCWVRGLSASRRLYAKANE